jgi:hypothetical protein
MEVGVPIKPDPEHFGSAFHHITPELWYAGELLLSV